MSTRPLTPKQARFIEVYAGNGTEAARLAGYGGDVEALSVTASKLLRLPKVADAIRSREGKKNRPLIATREVRQKFWTEAMSNPDHDMHVRLKASELLGKSEADFTERHEHRVSSIQIIDPYAVKPE